MYLDMKLVAVFSDVVVGDDVIVAISKDLGGNYVLVLFIFPTDVAIYTKHLTGFKKVQCALRIFWNGTTQNVCWMFDEITTTPQRFIVGMSDNDYSPRQVAASHTHRPAPSTA